MKEFLFSVIRSVLIVLFSFGFIFIIIWFVVLKLGQSKEVVIHPEGEVKKVDNKDTPDLGVLKNSVDKGINIFKKIQGIGK